MNLFRAGAARGLRFLRSFISKSRLVSTEAVSSVLLSRKFFTESAVFFGANLVGLLGAARLRKNVGMQSHIV